MKIFKLISGSPHSILFQVNFSFILKINDPEMTLK